MSNKSFQEKYTQTAKSYSDLYKMTIDGIKVNYVEGFNRSEIAEFISCDDFTACTPEGSVLITRDHGTYLKVSGRYWTRAEGKPDTLRLDVDILSLLITEEGYLCTLIIPKD